MKGLIQRLKVAPLWVKMTALSLIGGGVFVVALIGVTLAFVITAWFGQPIPVLGFEQTFEQPISFPHTIHAGIDVRVDDDGNPLVSAEGEMLSAIGLDCLFCHRTVEEQASAGVPAVQLCAHCHGVIGSEDEDDLVTLREAAGIVGDNEMAISWRRVHRLPDHVRFAHEPHIAYLRANPSAIANTEDEAILTAVTVPASAVCSTCHGDVAAMEQVYQVEALKMRQCVACHRANNAPTGCEACHY